MLLSSGAAAAQAVAPQAAAPAAAAADGAARQGGSTGPARPAPRDASSGFVIVGPASATWPGEGSSRGASISAAAIEDLGTKNNNLSLNLWATPVGDGVPVISPLLNFSAMAGLEVGPIKAGKSVTNLAQSGLTFTSPRKGCYYVMLAVLDNNLTLVDLWPFAVGGTPSPTGYNVFSFGGASCGQTSPCENSAQSACLLSGRFQVNGTFYNATSGKAQSQVQSFGGARAQSDESVFYFFADSSNFELGVKMLDACSLTNTFWVFLGGLTNQGWEINILDTKTGSSKTYTNSLNITSVTTTDTAAFPCP
jgi:hypothetical protein